MRLWLLHSCFRRLSIIVLLVVSRTGGDNGDSIRHRGKEEPGSSPSVQRWRLLVSHPERSCLVYHRLISDGVDAK